ncbi:hypothetical protein L4D06_18480 [Enterovibrio makurazakiensis]|uniref:hypothetical protein n=1 Tax=Enterovibrio makurazakiensis TaxID=2910232 RepID=UPI003D191D4A
MAVLTQNYKFTLSAITAVLILAGCGGGGDTADGNSPSSPAPTSSTVKGHVLDGQVASARVCFDMNNDLQCTDEDQYTETDSDGYFELTYEESSILETYTIIADVRQSTAVDSDYGGGRIHNDYVMTAFDPTREDVVISPVSSYINFESALSGKPANQVLSELTSTILQNEQFEYEASIETEVEYTELVVGNFVLGTDASDPHQADFNNRLHNLNEVVARKMQESQAYWEDRYWGGGVSLQDSSWSAHSGDVVFNANATTFQGFEAILEEVQSHDFSSFDAELIADSLWVDVAPSELIQELIDYNQLRSEVTDELTGVPYRSTVTFDGEMDYFYYWVFSDSNLRVYLDSTDGECIFTDVPFPYDATYTIQQFVDEFNGYVQNNSQFGVILGPMTPTNSVPANCSSVYAYLDDYNFDDDYDSADGDYKRVDPCKTMINCNAASEAAANINNRPMMTSNSPVQKGTPSLGGGSGGGSTTAPGSLGGACGYDGKNYVRNPCAKAPDKR